MKVVTIVGARPQFIKAAAVSRAFQSFTEIEEKIIHTGQHFDANMSDVFFDEMKIPKPHYNLNINGLGHGAMTGQMLEKIEKVLLDEKPDWVLVYGDTNSTLAGALAASKLHIKVAHVEAGLRSFNMAMPEEINRILTDRISNILFCPTDAAMQNLEKEGFNKMPIQIVKTGDVMQDAALFYASTARSLDFELPKKYVLCTIHRAENTDDPARLKSIFEALHRIGKKEKVVLPIHPRTRKIIQQLNINIDGEQIILIDPVGYLQMVYLIQHADVVMTDSGGLQKEAFFFKKPCLTLRDETEWVELVQHGFNTLVGADSELIVEAFDKVERNLNFEINLYGGGQAAQEVALNLLNFEA